MPRQASPPLSPALCGNWDFSRQELKRVARRTPYAASWLMLPWAAAGSDETVHPLPSRSGSRCSAQWHDLSKVNRCPAGDGGWVPSRQGLSPDFALTCTNTNYVVVPLPTARGLWVYACFTCKMLGVGTPPQPRSP